MYFVVFYFLTVSSFGSSVEVTCPSPWPTRSTAVGYEYCQCKRIDGLRIQCYSLSYWPGSAPEDTSELILDRSHMPDTLESYFLGRLAPRLKTFSCSHCRIRYIKKFAFFGLNSLEVINLEYNELTTIESYSFSGLTDIRHLNLAFNKIVTLEKLAFYGLRGTDKLDLSKNILSNIQINAFSNVSGIQQLTFNEIEAEDLKGYTLKGLSNIVLMSFTHSNIRKIDPYAFYGVNNVTTINFHSAKVRTISPFAFVGIGKVTEIKFKATEVSSLKCGVFEGLQCVRSIHWDESPIRCDCHLQWMVELSANISKDLTRGLTCVSPSEFSNQSPLELEKDAMGCDDEEKFMGCELLDTRVPRVQPLERYIEEVYGVQKSLAVIFSIPSKLIILLACLPSFL